MGNSPRLSQRSMIAVDQLFGNLQIAGLGCNPVEYVFKVLDCLRPQTYHQMFHWIDFERDSTYPLKSLRALLREVDGLGSAIDFCIRARMELKRSWCSSSRFCQTRSASRINSLVDAKSPASTRCLMSRFISGESVMLIFSAVDMVG